jgi:hypothetical protein
LIRLDELSRVDGEWVRAVTDCGERMTDFRTQFANIGDFPRMRRSVCVEVRWLTGAALGLFCSYIVYFRENALWANSFGVESLKMPFDNKTRPFKRRRTMTNINPPTIAAAMPHADLIST